MQSPCTRHASDTVLVLAKANMLSSYDDRWRCSAPDMLLTRMGLLCLTDFLQQWEEETAAKI